METLPWKEFASLGTGGITVVLTYLIYKLISDYKQLSDKVLDAFVNNTKAMEQLTTTVAVSARASEKNTEATDGMNRTINTLLTKLIRNDA